MTPGQQAFEEYYRNSNGIVFGTGKKLPLWDMLTPLVQAKWEFESTRKKKDYDR